MLRWLPAFLLALPSCGGGGGERGESGDTGSEEEPWSLPAIDPTICPELSFANVVDEAACDEIQGRGVEPVFADDIEMCRRLYVDLVGRLPTPAEYAADCEGRSVEAMVDDFMGRPGYVRQGQRYIADEFLMRGYYEYVLELDELGRRLYAGEIKLPRFAELALTSPAFTMRFAGEDRPLHAFQIFLGRPALVHERVGLEPLWHLWDERYEDAHPEYYFGYSRSVVYTMLCEGPLEVDCHSDTWGHESVVIPPVVEGDWDYEGVNAIRVEDLSAAEWDALRLPGRLIAQRPSFNEHAADSALQRYLGYDAGDAIPAARQALAGLMEANGGDVRALDREVLTSQLYTMSYERPDDSETPPEHSSPEFWRGPLRMLPAEAWLDSAGALTGVDPGACDHRFPKVEGGTPNPGDDEMLAKYHPNDYPKDPAWPADSNRPDYAYRDAAALLGGCPDQVSQLRFTGSGIMIAISQDALGQGVCSTVDLNGPIVPSNLLTANSSVEDLTGIAEHMIRAATLRQVEPQMRASIEAAVEGCRDDVDCDPLTFAFHLCNSTLKSASVVYY